MGQRGDVPTDGQAGVVPDAWAPNCSRRPDGPQARCHAHPLRAWQALVEHDEEARAARRQQLLRAVKRETDAARTAGADLHRAYDAILADACPDHASQPPLPQPQTGRPQRRPGHHRARRLPPHQDATLRFLTDLTVPFTNNEAARDRHLVTLHPKISGSFRTVQGAQHFAGGRTLLTTARQQGWDPLVLQRRNSGRKATHHYV